MIYKLRRDFEIVGTGRLFVRIQYMDNYSIPYHYLLEDKENYLFDIAVNPDNGQICYIKFFFKKKKILYYNENICTKVKKGIPCIDVSGFNDDYRDNMECAYIDFFFKDRCIYIFFSSDSVEYIINIDDSNEMFFNKEKILIGLSLKNLSDKELDFLITANLIDKNNV